MPSAKLIAEFNRARNRYVSATGDLVPLLIRMALGSISDALPGASEAEVDGSFNEDWLRTLRIQRILNQEGVVLFDIGFGHPDRQVEEAIDEVNTEYLDLLLDLTGDDYMGHKTIDLSDTQPARKSTTT